MQRFFTKLLDAASNWKRQRGDAGVIQVNTLLCYWKSGVHRYVSLVRTGVAFEKKESG